MRTINRCIKKADTRTSQVHVYVVGVSIELGNLMFL